jgi:hypothetical protein
MLRVELRQEKDRSGRRKERKKGKKRKKEKVNSRLAISDWLFLALVLVLVRQYAQRIR